MNSRLAHGGILLALGGNTVRLRPSLRAASHLERFQDGFPNLEKSLATFDLGTIREVITFTAIDRDDAERVIAAIDTVPLRTVANAVATPLRALLAAFVPADDNNAKPDPAAKPMPWADLYRELFRNATGWLGWTPEAAWSATPTEITEAFAGHVAMLKAIHGSGEEASEEARNYSAADLHRIEEHGFDPNFDREALRSLKDKIRSAR